MGRRIIIVNEEIKMILKRLDKIVESVRNRQKVPEPTFFDNWEFIQIMNISKRVQDWRDIGLIKFSRVGYKIYYLMSDMLELLNSNTKPNQS